MKKLCCIFVMSLFAFSSMASQQIENEQLARINSVLNAIYPLIAAAEKAAPANQRIQFHYDWLTQDIQSIQAGIAEKINQAPIMPRAVTPLKTQYVELMDKAGKAP